MAEKVKRRFNAARAGLMAAIFGVGVGVGVGVRPADDGGGADHVEAEPAASKVVKKVASNAIGSAQIKNNSIRLGDIKLHQVPSYKEYKEFVADLKAPTLAHKGEAYIKGEADALFLHKDEAYIKGEADALFMHKGETAENALKLDGLGADQIVQGHGQVVTGSVAVGNAESDVFILIGLLRASVMADPANGQASVRLTNLSGGPLMVNGDGKQATTTLGAGAVDMFTVADGTVRSLQIVGGTRVTTLTLSSFTGGTRTLVGQVVVGTP